MSAVVTSWQERKYTEILKYRPDNHFGLCPQYQTSKRKDPQTKGGAPPPQKKKEVGSTRE